MKTKYEEGYISSEIASLVEQAGFTMEQFWKEFGMGNTVFAIGNETIYFHRDVEDVLYRLKTGEKENPLTWD